MFKKAIGVKYMSKYQCQINDLTVSGKYQAQPNGC